MQYYIVIHSKMHFLQPNSRFQVTNENFYIVGKHLIFHVKLKRKKKTQTHKKLNDWSSSSTSWYFYVLQRNEN